MGNFIYYPILLKLRCEVEANILEILLRKGECIACVGKEYIASVLIDSHIRVLATLEVGQLLGVVALNPARLVDRDWLPAALCTIFVLQTILDNLKLELTNCTNNLASVE